MCPPVLILGFNRPDKLRRVMEPLRMVRPAIVFLSIDGPRADREGEEAKCLESRAAAEAMIDWPCEIVRMYRESNLGCRRAVRQAITDALTQVEELIIVEDDCVLDPSFFALCAELLPRHRADTAIMSISAVNFQHGQARGDGDYYASKYQHCWGWATWRRAWAVYQDDIGALREAVEGTLARALHATEDERAYWQIIHERCARGEVDSWAYRWLFSCWMQGGLTLIPNHNLVTNIGFDDQATHTTGGSTAPGEVRALATFRAPASLEPVAEADTFTFANVFCPVPSHAQVQVSHHRIKRLKAELKQCQRQLVEAETRLKSPRRPWWRRLF